MNKNVSCNVRQLRMELSLTQRDFIQRYLLDSSGVPLISISKLSMIENNLNSKSESVLATLEEKLGLVPGHFDLSPDLFLDEIRKEIVPQQEREMLLDANRQSECPRSNDVAALLCDYFTECLLRGTLRRGEKIPSERELARMFSLSRTVIREAIVGLTFVGFLEARQGQGTFVSLCHSNFFDSSILWNIMVGEKTKADLQETRALLEAESAYCAAKRGTDEDFTRFFELLADFKKHAEQGSINDFVQTDYDFHLSIAEASKNKITFELFKTIRNLMMFYSKTGITKTEDLYSIYQEHEDIINEMVHRNADGARARMRYHIDQSGERAKARDREL